MTHARIATSKEIGQNKRGCDGIQKRSRKLRENERFKQSSVSRQHCESRARMFQLSWILTSLLERSHLNGAYLSVHGVAEHGRFASAGLYFHIEARRDQLLHGLGRLRHTPASTEKSARGQTSIGSKLRISFAAIRMHVARGSSVQCTYARQ